LKYNIPALLTTPTSESEENEYFSLGKSRLILAVLYFLKNNYF
jgi:hypothetical protein